MNLLIIYVLAIVIVVFVIGLGIGWVLTKDSTLSQNLKLKTGISIAVTIVWMFTVVADVFMTGYTLSPLVHAIMGAVVGYFFTDGDVEVDATGD